MYNLYKEALSDKGRAILDSCSITVAEEALMLELLESIKKFHPEFNHIKTITDFTTDEVKTLRVGKQQKLFIDSYINTYTIILENQIKARVASKIHINKVQFSYILINFNRLLWRAMIDKAYVFKHKLIGSIYVVCRENPICKPKMKWKESLANKQAILDKGGKPRIELQAREAEFNGTEYIGEEWIERHDPFNLAIKWRRSVYANLKVATIKDFNLKLVRTGIGNGVVDALKEERDNNKLEDLIIKYHKAND